MQLEQERTKRIAELNAEIRAAKDLIQRSHSDERMLERILEPADLHAELADLRDERARLEGALFNLTKELRGLGGSHHG
jgi:hypothetical protein